MHKQTSLQMLMWFVAMLGLGLAGFWYFRVPTPWSATALVAAALFYVGAMVVSVLLSTRKTA